MTAQVPPNSVTPPLLRLLRSRDAGIAAAAAILFIVFAVSAPGFLTAFNLFNVSRTIGFFVLIALSQAVVLAIGGMNLSVGAIGGLATITLGYGLARAHLPAVAAVLLALTVGMAAGAVNGLAITRLKLNSFIVTLATLFIFTGLVFGLSEGYAYTGIPAGFTALGRGKLVVLSDLFWAAVMVLVAAHVLFRHLAVGRWLLATGANATAVRLSGISTDRLILFANVLSGLLAALAAVLWVSRMGSAQPATGKDWLITSFAVAIVGGTGLTGGSLSSFGILMGAVIIVLIKNGLVMLKANVYYEQAFMGAIILVAVALDRLRGVWSGRE